MMKYFNKCLNCIFWIMDKIAKKQFIALYPKYLKWLGVDIDEDDTQGTWISPSVFLDSSRYDLLSIGKKVTISFDVSILVHDYSIVHAARAKELKCKSIIYKPVVIGDNVFIGAKSVILPGTTIGDNCIIGGGTVVKGILEANYVYAGNPCKKIMHIDDYLGKYQDLIEKVEG